MKQYIDKDTLIAEIERLINSNKPLKTLDPTYYEGLDDSLDNVLSFIDTLEVKEVNLEKEANEAWNYIFSHGWDENSRMVLKHDEYMEFAKHFFELGLNAKNE